jgi:hypothetical protein
MLLSRHHNAEQDHDIKIANRCFENVAQFKYLGTTVTVQNYIQKEIKSKLNSGNVCYHSVQNLLSSRLLSKKRKNYNIVTCTGVRVTIMTGSSSDDWIYLQFGYNLLNYN